MIFKTLVLLISTFALIWSLGTTSFANANTPYGGIAGTGAEYSGAATERH
jgi:hypothetical protein